ncbi:MAG: hypothetical protein P9L99_11215 [Candidatus Lernaella stagnicola]|nr:hypothetical protein [Candidatus Lernaella stagnicola]
MNVNESDREMAMRGHYSPEEAQNLMLFILERANHHLSLTQQDCARLVDTFMYPNLIHWATHLARRSPAKTATNICPLYHCATQCMGANFAAPTHVAEIDGREFCARRERKHPWAMIVTLLWNNAVARESGNKDIEPPYRQCAWDVFENIQHKEPARIAWSAVELSKRPEAVREAWNHWADGVEQAFTEVQRLERQAEGAEWLENVTATLMEHIDPVRLLNLVWHVSQSLDGWRRAQRSVPEATRERIHRTLVDIGKLLAFYHGHVWTLATDLYPLELGALRDMLAELRPHGWEDIIALLEQEEVTPVELTVVREFLQKSVKPLASSGLPPGPARNDLLVQDLFWDWIGLRPRPDSGRSFQLTDWCRRRWETATDRDEPRWRTIA